MYDLVVVIPVYNEEEIIKFVIRDWVKVLDGLDINYRIFVYDDGSSDDTEKEILSVVSGLDNVDLVSKSNSGHGPTILRGYKDNLENATWIFQVDSDNEMSPKYFPYLWEVRERYDFLIGYRHNRDFSFMRLMLTLLSRVVVFTLFGSKVKDVNSPYRLFRSSFFSRDIKSIDDATFAPNVILSGIASLRNARIKSIDVPYHFRTTGTVSLKEFKLLKIGAKCFSQTLKFTKKLKMN